MRRPQTARAFFMITNEACRFRLAGRLLADLLRAALALPWPLFGGPCGRSAGWRLLSCCEMRARVAQVWPKFNRAQDKIVGFNSCRRQAAAATPTSRPRVLGPFLRGPRMKNQKVNRYKFAFPHFHLPPPPPIANFKLNPHKKTKFGLPGGRVKLMATPPDGEFDEWAW